MSASKNYELQSLIPDRDYSSIRADKIKTEAIRPVGEAFYANMARVDSLSLFPPLVFLQADEYAKKGSASWTYQESTTNTTAGFGLCGDLPDYKQATERLKPGMDRIQELSAFPPAGVAIDSWMASLILGAWTAIETLAGDLWEAAVNAQPARLAELTGTEKRIGKLVGEKAGVGDADISHGDEPDLATEGKHVSLRDIGMLTRGSYDLSHKMGTLLKGRFKFTTLRGIREAYSSAFSENEKKARTAGIDNALRDKGLDALNAVRNLIVHKAGIADAEYEQKAKNTPPAPQLKEKDKLELDGNICRRLIDSGVRSSIELVKAVDSWLVLTS
jgi:hypothetical protein